MTKATVLINGNRNVLIAALNEGFSKQAVAIREYKSKIGEVSNVIVDTEASYMKLVEASVAFMRHITTEEIVEQTGVDPETVEKARGEMISSFKNTLEKGAGNNDAYNHSAKNRVDGIPTYQELSHGVKLHLESGNIQVQGIVITKTTLVEGVYPASKKRDKTIAKDAFRDQLPVGKWRQYTLTHANIDKVIVGEKVFEAAHFGGDVE